MLLLIVKLQLMLVLVNFSGISFSKKGLLKGSYLKEEDRKPPSSFLGEILSSSDEEKTSLSLT